MWGGVIQGYIKFHTSETSAGAAAPSRSAPPHSPTLSLSLAVIFPRIRNSYWPDRNISHRIHTSLHHGPGQILHITQNRWGERDCPIPPLYGPVTENDVSWITFNIDGLRISFSHYVSIKHADLLLKFVWKRVGSSFCTGTVEVLMNVEPPNSWLSIFSETPKPTRPRLLSTYSCQKYRSLQVKTYFKPFNIFKTLFLKS